MKTAIIKMKIEIVKNNKSNILEDEAGAGVAVVVVLGAGVAAGFAGAGAGAGLAFFIAASSSLLACSALLIATIEAKVRNVGCKI